MQKQLKKIKKQKEREEENETEGNYMTKKESKRDQEKQKI